MCVEVTAVIHPAFLPRVSPVLVSLSTLLLSTLLVCNPIPELWHSSNKAEKHRDLLSPLTIAKHHKLRYLLCWKFKMCRHCFHFFFQHRSSLSSSWRTGNMQGCTRAEHLSSCPLPSCHVLLFGHLSVRASVLWQDPVWGAHFFSYLSEFIRRLCSSG